MTDTFPVILKKALRGHDAHLDPMKGLRGLTAEIAQKQTGQGFHSCWDILYHMVYWQDFVLAAIRGEEASWPKVPLEDWPSDVSERKDFDWDKIVERFERGLEEAKKLAGESDLTKPMPAWGEAPTAKALIVLIQHNSYHLGQIVANRRLLGDWPPPKQDSL